MKKAYELSTLTGIRLLHLNFGCRQKFLVPAVDSIVGSQSEPRAEEPKLNRFLEPEPKLRIAVQLHLQLRLLSVYHGLEEIV